MYDEYWDAFERFVRAAGHEFELRKPGSRAYFRRIRIDGVPVSHAHFAVAVSTSGSHVRPAGVRVQLVLEGKFASHYAPELVAQRPQIDGEIPEVQWLADLVRRRTSKCGQRITWTSRAPGTQTSRGCLNG